MIGKHSVGNCSENGGYRFLVLFFNCMLTFGSYFCFDMPSVLQTTFTDTNNCTTSNFTCNNCTDCLGMSQDDYNLLYAIYAWTNAAVVIAAGFLIDKMGNRVGAFLFSFLCVLGSSTFAASLFFRGTAVMFPLMLVGRLLFGSGNGSLTIVQNRITSYWFKEKELAMAFGITLCFSRLGSVLNFFSHRVFKKKKLFLQSMFFYSFYLSGAFLCLLGFISAILVSFLDKWGVQQLGDDASQKSNSKKLDIIGKRGILAFLCAFLTIPVFGLLAFSMVYPLVATFWLGVTYSFAAASMWPTIPLVVTQATVGTAMGLTTSLQMIGIGISNLVVGQILGKKDDNLNSFQGGLLNISRKQKQQLLQEREQLIKGLPESHGESDGEENDPLLPGRRHKIN
ncbi:hypothetical protein C0Q70_17002 [Pomacea canaliculata]|uniref:Lysosomal dipeptide transporter MFSD1 n=1 Tax=Pomacea canaliculata TaxID=400727 RepID=A0A2T7NRC5_POMCA|nr:hypothetical protein C0Q70_17002 [Pomacea canaliculata]